MAVVVSRSAPYVEVSRINENVLSVFQDSGQGSVNLVEGIADGSSLVCHSDSQFVLRYFPGAFAVCTLCSHNLYWKLQLNHTGLITGLGPFGCFFLVQRQGHISAQSTDLRKVCGIVRRVFSPAASSRFCVPEATATPSTSTVHLRS